MSSSSQRIRKIVAFLAVLFMGALAGALLASFVEGLVGQIDLAFPPLYALIPLLVLLAFLSIFIHEMGHVLGGLLARFRFIMLIVGPLKVVREGSQLSVGLNRSFQMGGGMALCVPEKKEASAGGLFLYLAGGPLLSLAAGIFSTLVAVALQGAGLDVDYPYLSSMLIFSAFFNGGIALITLLPLPTVGYENDGRQLLDVFRGGRRARAKLLLSVLSSEAIRGLRPRDWTVVYILDLLNHVSDERPESGGAKNVAVANLMAYYHYLDTGATEKAGHCVTRIAAVVQETPTMLQPGLWLEVLYFQARHDWEIEGAAVAPAEISGPFLEKHSLLRLKAARLWAQEQFKESIECAREAIAFAEQATFQAGVVEAETEWLQAIIADSELALASS